MRLPRIQATLIFPKRLVYEFEFSRQSDEKWLARTQFGDVVSRLQILLLGERGAARSRVLARL